ncbi:MAG TPA: M20/M25/M40 family metallo-hydrolase, partial [Tepidisphaeraceae bacterium]|nr:M20/M25/M40 family metallo-hydrolase [Tepidisphaeraceae bacterium]
VSTDPAYDDFAGLDLKGKVALFMRYGPHDEQGEPRIGRMRDLATRAKAAADRGAVGVLIVHPPRHRGPDELLPYVSPFGERRIGIPAVQVTIEVANHLLATGRQPDLNQLQQRIDATFKPASVDVADARVSGAVVLKRTRETVKNVVGVLPGRTDEYVVVGAHYDHLGRGVGGIGLRVPPTTASTRPSTRPTGPQVYNGADDNASGVAAMLDLARRLSAPGERPQRSVVFVAFTAEEHGVVGSQHFVEHPPVPLDKVVAMLNLDMVGRVKDDTLFVGGTGTAPSFDALVRRADERSPLQVKFFGKGGLGPSDHMSFALKKVPVLFLFSGLHPDYHRPTDDADKINYAGMERVVGFAQTLLDGMLAMPREQYVDAADAGGSMAGGRPGAALGVIPDYSVSDAGGLRIAGVSPESAAAKAGLKGGDVVVRVGAHAVENIYDLTDALADAKPGDHVSVAVLRDGQRLELPAVLTVPRRRSD